MKPKDKRTGLLVKGLALGAEFALSVVFLIFLGYFLGDRISELMAIVGIVLGAFLGLALGTYRLIKRVG